VTLTNAGNSSITISNVVVGGAGFTADGGVSGTMLSAGQTVSLSGTFAPATAGSVTGSVTVTSNASNSPLKITLSGTGVAQVAHSVALSWAASTSMVTGYNVYSSTVSGGPYVETNTSPVGTTSYTDSNVQAGQTYYFVVTSVDSTNLESSYSTQVSAAVP
jgi:fibronectin type 3 domain-containing protein